MDDDLRIGCRLEDTSATHQLAANTDGVCEITVMCDRKATKLQIGEQRLHVPQVRFARRRVTRVANRHIAF